MLGTIARFAARVASARPEAAANILGTRIKRTGDGERLPAFGRDTEWLGTHVYLSASLVVLVFGLLTALKGHYSFGQAWLLFGSRASC
jgi:hypothetical protein